MTQHKALQDTHPLLREGDTCSAKIDWPSVLTVSVVSTLKTAEKYYGRVFECPEITMDLRGRAAGQFRFITKGRRMYGAQLRFNRALLEQYQQDFIDEVVPHEVAHLVTYVLYGRGVKPHGKEWQSIMLEVFGREASVRHSFDTSSLEQRKGKRFPYLCQCSGRVHQLGLTRHKRAQSRGTAYICRSCKASLIPSKASVVA